MELIGFWENGASVDRTVNHHLQKDQAMGI